MHFRCLPKERICCLSQTCNRYITDATLYSFPKFIQKNGGLSLVLYGWCSEDGQRCKRNNLSVFTLPSLPSLYLFSFNVRFLSLLRNAAVTCNHSFNATIVSCTIICCHTFNKFLPSYKSTRTVSEIVPMEQSKGQSNWWPANHSLSPWQHP